MKKSMPRKFLFNNKSLQLNPASFFPALFFIFSLFIFPATIFCQTPGSWHNGQCAVNCNNHINITLNIHGEAIIDPLLVWESGGGDVCWTYLDSVHVNIDGAETISGILDGDTGTGVPYTSALLDCARAGDTFEYSLDFFFNDGITENSCWGTITLEDKLPPEISCTDAIIFCNQSASVDSIGAPVVFDNCDNDVSLTSSDVFTQLDCDTPFENIYITARLDRTWTATDDLGNVSSCTQVIYFQKATLDDVDIPLEISLDCNDDPLDLNLTGQPTINGYSVNADDLCNIGVTFTDQVFSSCGNSRQIVRSWIIVDWCPIYGSAISETVTHTQIIKLEDTTKPAFLCPSDFTVNMDQDICAAFVTVPEIDVEDDCGGFNIEITTDVGNVDENGGVTPEPMSPGIHNITYIVTDDCGNTTVCSVNVTVVDEVNPVAVCDEHTVLALNSDGNGQLCWESLDAGSYDNCEITEHSIRRLNAPAGTAFTSCIPFTCEDAGQTIEIVLKVTDAAGNENTCIVLVDIQDKLEPVIACPGYITLECGADYNDLTVTGTATANDNCGIPEITYIDSLVIDNCGKGDIFRTWFATDVQGAVDSCLQIISLINSDPFSPQDFSWPQNHETNACGAALDPENLPPNAAYPVVSETDCDQVSVTYEDEVLPVTETACLQVLRRWTIVNWCEFNPNFIGDVGRWEHVQVIKVFNSEDPVITTACEDIQVCGYDDNCGNIPVELIILATDDCSDSLELNYNYTIDLFSDGNDDLNGYANDASGEYPTGTHTIFWEVEDGCGNITACDYRFKISDCKKPSPICINGLAAEIMPSTGAITIWASDFESGSSFDNCTPYEELIFSFSENVADTSITFTCADRGQQPVDLWITDADGNQDFCSTYILIQDNQSVCPDPIISYASISGSVQNELQEMIEAVAIEINGSNLPAISTGTAGTFIYPELQTGENYTVIPSKNIDPLNGVTTLDLVLISKHILNILPLDSPYKIIAADANRSNTVTTLDMVQIRRLILNVDTEFAAGDAWRFIDKNFTFPNADNPFETAFPEVYNINNMESDEFPEFVGVKVGDVNNSAIPNSEAQALRTNKTGELVLLAKDRKITAGKTVSVDFFTENFQAVSGFQFTLNFDNRHLEFVDFQTGNLKNMNAGNFGFNNMENGIITCSWNDAKAIPVDKNTTLFQLTFEAKENGTLKDLLAINSSVTVAEAYTATHTQDVSLAFQHKDGQKFTNGFALYQNTPNPVDNETIIGFNLNKDDEVSLKIIDLSGKVLKVLHGNFTKGYHQFEIETNALPATGVVYYQLNTSQGAATRKMLLMN